MKYTFCKKILAILLLITIGVLSLLSNRAQAASAADWRPGNIISDQLFFTSGAMSVDEVQSFLNSQVSSCDTWGTKAYNASQSRAQYGISIGTPPPYICLKDYYENPTTHETNFNPTASIPTGAKSAAQIIADAAATYNISPKVLLVTLKKEASLNLIGDDWPMLWQYRTAMGYGCPDTAPCDAQYYGFYNQINNAARQFHNYATYPSSYRYKAYQSNFIQYNPNTSCSGSYVYIDNQATAGLYNYTPYQPNAAAMNNLYGLGDGCSAYGNRNFWRLWSDWFGSTTGPAAFTVPGSNQIYMPVLQYKLAVPYAAAMQDYGVSWESIKDVSQQYSDSITLPPAASGISSLISHVVKTPSDTDADGGSIYLISLGKRYQFQSMDQFFAFGFKESDISYLPIEYILSKQSGGMLSNFIKTPYGSVFEVDVQNKVKRLIFEYSTYISRNPSDSITNLSYYLADKIPSSNPITSRPVFIQAPTGGSVVLYQNDKYYAIPDYDVFSCWGFSSPISGIPTYRLPQADYVATTPVTASLSCAITQNGTNYILNSSTKYTDSILSIPRLDISANTTLSEIAQKLPISSPLRSYVKSPDSAAVWWIGGSNKRIIPSYNDFTLLSLKASSIDTVNTSLLKMFNDGGLLLADGLIVKTADSAVVYAISENTRIAYGSSYVFESFNNPWSNIETYPSSQLDITYPAAVSDVSTVLVDKQNNKAFVVNLGACYILSADTLNRMGKSIDTLSLSQSYNSNVFRNFSTSNCTTESTNFIKSPGSSLVFWLSGGQKHPLLTYRAMLGKNGGSSPLVMVIDDSFLNSITAGESYSQ